MHETIPFASLRRVQLTIVYIAILWFGTFTTPVRLRLCEPGNKIFVHSPSIVSCGSRFTTVWKKWRIWTNCSGVMGTATTISEVFTPANL